MIVAQRGYASPKFNCLPEGEANRSLFSMRAINSHARNDRFSLLLHREAAGAVARDEALLVRAEAILRSWKQSNGINACRDWDEWLSLIARGPSVVVQVMVSEDEYATRLRQSSPFSVLVPPRKRWALLKEAKHEQGAA
ncbi:MAG: hypothetical protein B7X43_04260 [Thiomonas sp. 15-63-373]|nr:MAG: hypothetical protein B7X43_04260 [Thiomonas sp. 15-63-373]